MDLVRFILIETEKADGRFGIERFVTEQRTMELVGYHVELMQAHGLLDAAVQREWGGSVVAGSITALTWDGCDYLDAIRNDGIYQKTKEAVSEAVGATTMDLFKDVAVAIGKAVILSSIGM